MAALVCEICGGKLIARAGGLFECDSCGMQYDKSRIQEMVQEIKGTVKVEGTVEVQGTVKVEGAASAQSLLKRGQMALEDRKFDEAKKHFNQALDIDPECGMAYWGLALIAEKGRFDKLVEVCLRQEPKEIQRARRFADAETRAELKKLDEAKNAILQHIEEKKENLPVVRRHFEKAKNLIYAGYCGTAGIKADGTVVAVGSNTKNMCNVDVWIDVAAISEGSDYTVVLKPDGTVVAVGENKYGQCDVDDWTGIVAISAGSDHTVGLKADGTVVAVGCDDFDKCQVSDWTDIVAISAGTYHTVGLKADGTVVAVGDDEGQCDVSDWTDIVAISARGRHTVGLKADGTVVTKGYIEEGLWEASKWTDIVAISAGTFHIVGLKTDGTVVAVGHDDEGQRDNVSKWTNIVAVSAGGRHTVGLKSDGTVLAVGQQKHGQCDVSGWKLFDSLDTLEQERNKAKKSAPLRQAALQNARRAASRAGLYAEKAKLKAELPNLKGLFSASRRKQIETRLAEIEKELKGLE